MRSLDPARSGPSQPPIVNDPSNNPIPKTIAYPSPVQSQGINAGTELEAVTVTSPQGKASAGKAYRFRTDNWLSVEDANFLLQKRACWHTRQNNYAAALQIFDKLVAFEPDNAEHYANRGLMHSHLKLWKESLADYNQALEINPELDSAYNNRANLHAKANNWAEAIFDYDNAIDINPLNIRARLNQAITFREMGHYDEAIACLDVALFFRAESALIYAERGRTYHLRGDWNCAIADYKTAMTLTQRSTADEPSRPLCNPKIVNQRVKKWMESLT